MSDDYVDGGQTQEPGTGGLQQYSNEAEKLRNHIKGWFDHFRRNNKMWHENYNMVMGKQWDATEVEALGTLNKQPLQFNKLLPIVNYMSGVFQQNTPDLQLEATDDTPAEIAEVRQAILLDICFNSDTTHHTQIAFQQKVIGGYSARYVYPEYENDNTFDQIAKVRSFDDPTKCFWSKDCQHPNKIDSRLSGFIQRMSRAKAEAMHGNILQDVGYDSQGTMIGDQEEESPSVKFWDEESVTILNVFERIYEPYNLNELSNGVSLRNEDLKKLEKVEVDGIEFLMYQNDNGEFEPVKIIRERRVPYYRVEHSQWIGDYQVDVTDFPSQFSPIVFEDQNSRIDKKGRQITQGFFEQVSDSQRMLNYLKTQASYILSRQRYDQFLISKENARSKDTQAIWKDPTVILGALYYDEAKSGNKPQQLMAPELPQSLLVLYESTLNDIYSGTGVYPTQIGQVGNEVSGLAINSRREAASFATYPLTNSSNQALNAIGTIINDMIPNIYDTERNIRLEMPDRGNSVIKINQPNDKFGNSFNNDMTKGSFKVRVLAGDSIEGQQEETLQAITMMLQQDPAIFATVGDLFVDSLKLKANVKRELKNRIRAALVPPELVEAGKTGKPLPPKPTPPDPQVMKQQNEMMKLQQQSQIAQQNFVIKMHDIQLREKKLELDGHVAGSQAAIDMQELKAQADEVKAKYVETQHKLQTEIARIHADVLTSHHENIAKIITSSSKPKALGNQDTIN